MAIQPTGKEAAHIIRDSGERDMRLRVDSATGFDRNVTGGDSPSFCSSL